MLGLLAAGSAAILIRAMHLGQAATQAPPTVDVIVAAGELPPMTVLRPEHIRIEKIVRGELPRDCCTNPVQAIGRVLSVPVVQGQAFKREFFLPDSGPAASVATIPAGMRVFTISVPSRSINPALIYPGCIVDVQATFDLSPASQGETIATTVLRGIKVQAIENEVIAAPQTADSGKAGKSVGSYGGALRVSLLVNTKQLESLQLASERGSIALAICGPLDKTPIEQPGTIFDQDYLRTLGLPQSPPAPDTAPRDADAIGPAPAPPPQPLQDVEIIQGQDRRKQSFPVEPPKNGPGS